MANRAGSQRVMASAVGSKRPGDVFFLANVSLVEGVHGRLEDPV